MTKWELAFLSKFLSDWVQSVVREYMFKITRIVLSLRYLYSVEITDVATLTLISSFFLDTLFTHDPSNCACYPIKAVMVTLNQFRSQMLHFLLKFL